jgi:hypothetical protein
MVVLTVVGCVLAATLGYFIYQEAGSGSAAAQTPADSGTAASTTAASWLASQVSQAETITCDPAMCVVLKADGIQATRLRELRPGQNRPPRSALVAVTPVLRSQLSSALEAGYAPAIIASFGVGAGRVQIRQVTAHGPAAYATELSADLMQRRESGAELLTSDRIAASAQARRQLTAGHVDTRLLVTIAGFASLRPVRIAAFGDQAPGIGPGVSPLRAAVLAAPPGASRSAGLALVRALTGFLQAQRSPFAVTAVRRVKLPGGELGVSFEFPAPSPLGLLTGAGPG